VPPPGEGQAASGTTLGAAPAGGWPKPSLELGHQFPADHGAWCVVLPLFGGRRLEPQSGGLGCGRGGVGSDRSGSGAACLPQGALPPPQQLWQTPLILHADNGSAMRGATLESRLEEMGVLRSFSRPRVSNDNPYSETLFRTVKYRPDYPSRPFATKEEACQWVAAFVDCYNHRHHLSGIKFVTPHQRHSGSAKVNCQQRAELYEAAHRANPTRLSRRTCCWRQPEEVRMNMPPEENELGLELALMQVARVAAQE